MSAGVRGAGPTGAKLLPALRENIVREVIDRVKGGGLVFGYTDQRWLDASKYLGNCAAATSAA
jgi:hypothetical protein